jgi:hypothetical protein
MTTFVLGLDPGNHKVGAALLSVEGDVVRRGVLSVLSLRADLASFVGNATDDLDEVVLGDGTNSSVVLRELVRLFGSGFEPVMMDETASTLEARKLFYENFPPPLPMRILPRGLWPEPDVPLDGFAAEVLVRRYLKTSPGGSTKSKKKNPASGNGESAPAA